VEREADAPIDSACSNEQHAAMAAGQTAPAPIRFIQ